MAKKWGKWLLDFPRDFLFDFCLFSGGDVQFFFSIVIFEVGFTPEIFVFFCGFDNTTNTAPVGEVIQSVPHDYPGDEPCPKFKSQMEGNQLHHVKKKRVDDSWVNWHVWFAKKRETCNLWSAPKWSLIFWLWTIEIGWWPKFWLQYFDIFCRWAQTPTRMMNSHRIMIQNLAIARFDS